jgi:hypothetical protein
MRVAGRWHSTPADTAGRGKASRRPPRRELPKLGGAGIPGAPDVWCVRTSWPGVSGAPRVKVVSAYLVAELDERLGPRELAG